MHKVAKYALIGFGGVVISAASFFAGEWYTAHYICDKLDAWDKEWKNNRPSHSKYTSCYPWTRTYDATRCWSLNKYFLNRDDALNLCNEIRNHIDEFGYVSIEDVKILSGSKPYYSDSYWGWNRYDNEKIEVVREGHAWIVKFPPARCL